MSNFAYLSHDDNLLTSLSGVALSPSSAAVGYSADKVASPPVTKRWRTTGCADEFLNITHLSIGQPNFIGVFGHNFSSSATITVYAANVPGPISSPSYSTSLTYRKYDAFGALAPGASYPYWAVRIQDPTNTSGYIQFGYLMLGTLTTASFNIANDWRRHNEYANLRISSPMDAPHVAALFQRVRIGIDFNTLSAAEAATLIAFFDTLDGLATPFFFQPDAAIYEGYLVRLGSSPQQSISINRNIRSVELIEDSHGRIV